MCALRLALVNAPNSSGIHRARGGPSAESTYDQTQGSCGLSWITGGVALAAAAPGLRVSAAQNQRVPPPRVIVSERHDRLPALRTMPRLVRRSTPAREIPNHARPTRRVNPSIATTLMPDPVVQRFTGTPLVPGSSRSFDGLDNASGVLPPDTNGDARTHHFFQTVNLSLAIYSKGTATTPPALLYGPVRRQHAVEWLRRPVRDKQQRRSDRRATTISPIAGS